MGDPEPTPGRRPLDVDWIVAEAVAIADTEGVGALNMRGLADRLGYTVMALYNHVPSKDSLMALMVDSVAAEIDLTSDAVDPLEAVREMVVSTRAALLRHPWAADQWQRHLPGPARTAHMERLLRLLDASGLAPDLAHHGFHAVSNHVIGYTLQELGMALSDKPMSAGADAFLATISAETHPYMVAHVQQHIDGQSTSSFELVLDLILEGLSRRNEG